MAHCLVTGGAGFSGSHICEELVRRGHRVREPSLLENRSPKIYGDGEQTRDFTYVANVVDGVLRACAAPGVSGEVINVATGGRISLNELFRQMRALIGADVEPTDTDGRAGDVRDSRADISKARRLLGYEPIVSFEEGLRRTVEWYRGAPAAATA